MTLERTRTLGEMLRDALALFAAHWRTYLLIAAALIVPIELLVHGVGLSELSGPYTQTPTLAARALKTGVSYFLTGPLVSAALLLALVDPKPSARRALEGALALWPALLAVVVLYSLIVFAGLVALIVPGVILAIRLTFYVQALVLEQLGPGAALRRSWGLTAGAFWRVLGINVVLQLIASFAATLVTLPFASAARSANSDLPVLIGDIASGIIVMAPTVIAQTLLFFDLRRRAAVAA